MSSQEVLSDFYELVQLSSKSFTDKVNKRLNIHKEALKGFTVKAEAESRKYAKFDEEILQKIRDTEKLRDSVKHDEEALASLLQKEAESLARVEVLRKETESVIEQVKSKSQELRSERESLDAQKRLIQNKCVTMSASAELFNKYLGLEVRVLKGNRIQFVFRGIDDKDPDLLAYIIISLNNRLYGVTESFPTLENLNAMENALNKTNDLAGFIQHSRKSLLQALTSNR